MTRRSGAPLRHPTDLLQGGALSNLNQTSPRSRQRRPVLFCATSTLCFHNSSDICRSVQHTLKTLKFGLLLRSHGLGIQRRTSKFTTMVPKSLSISHTACYTVPTPSLASVRIIVLFTGGKKSLFAAIFYILRISWVRSSAWFDCFSSSKKAIWKLFGRTLPSLSSCGLFILTTAGPPIRHCFYILRSFR